MVYATKFREKGEKKYKTCFIVAKDYEEYREGLLDFLKDEAYDVDKRTLQCAGGSVPFMTGTRPEVIDVDLDEVS